VLKNKVLRRVFGPKREEATEGNPNEELRSLCPSPDII
jgi:hypothetical protein